MPPDTEQFPSVNLAYDFIVKSSYDQMIKRSEVMDGRMQGFIAYVTTITVAIPAFVAATHATVAFNSRWFTYALVVFGANVVGGTITRFWGALSVISPKQIFDKWLTYTESEFKTTAIYWAGEDFEKNRVLINFKGNVLSGMAFMLFLEISFLAFWLNGWR